MKLSSKHEIKASKRFQGREKDFIILSNVRSNDNKGIGFLRDFRRLNVSITRAKYGLIIIGDSECLSKDSHIWAKFINYYEKNGLLVEPNIEKDNEIIIKCDIDDLKIKNRNEQFLDNLKVFYQEYDFDASSNEPNINEDLLNNFECTENVYGEGNKKYYRKKKEKKEKKKKKKYKNNKSNYYYY